MKKKETLFLPEPWDCDIRNFEVCHSSDGSVITSFEIKISSRFTCVINDPHEFINANMQLIRKTPQMHEILEQLPHLGTGVEALIKLQRLQSESAQVLAEINGGKING